MMPWAECTGLRFHPGLQTPAEEREKQLKEKQQLPQRRLNIQYLRRADTTEENELYFCIDPERVSQAERILFALLSDVHVLVDAVGHLHDTRVEGLSHTSSYI